MDLLRIATGKDFKWYNYITEFVFNKNKEIYGDSLNDVFLIKSNHIDNTNNEYKDIRIDDDKYIEYDDYKDFKKSELIEIIEDYLINNNKIYIDDNKIIGKKDKTKILLNVT